MMWRIVGGHRPERHGQREMDTIRAAELARMAARTRVQIGLDVARLNDYTGLVVAERERRDDGKDHHLIRVIDRFPHGLSWQQQANRVAEVVARLLDRNEAARSRGDRTFGRLDVVVDATGGGSAMIDLLRERRLRPVGVTITGTDRQVEHDKDRLSVGKAYLISRLQAWAEDRIHLPQTPEGDIVIGELRDCLPEMTAAGNLTFNARSGQNDDLVLALALACVVDVPARPATVFAIRKVQGRW